MDTRICGQPQQKEPPHRTHDCKELLTESGGEAGSLQSSGHILNMANEERDADASLRHHTVQKLAVAGGLRGRGERPRADQGSLKGMGRHTARTTAAL